MYTACSSSAWISGRIDSTQSRDSPELQNDLPTPIQIDDSPSNRSTSFLRGDNSPKQADSSAKGCLASLRTTLAFLLIFLDFLDLPVSLGVGFGFSLSFFLLGGFAGQSSPKFSFSWGSSSYLSLPIFLMSILMTLSNFFLSFLLSSRCPLMQVSKKYLSWEPESLERMRLGLSCSTPSLPMYSLISSFLIFIRLQMVRYHRHSFLYTQLPLCLVSRQSQAKKYPPDACGSASMSKHPAPFFLQMKCRLPLLGSVNILRVECVAISSSSRRSLLLMKCSSQTDCRGTGTQQSKKRAWKRWAWSALMLDQIIEGWRGGRFGSGVYPIINKYRYTLAGRKADGAGARLGRCGCNTGCDNKSNISGRMGVLESKPGHSQRKGSGGLKAIEDIYLMFEEGNRVIVASTKPKGQTSKYTMRDMEQLLSQLLQPFLEQQKYQWGREIFERFNAHFGRNFGGVWESNREQFYELLLMNCQLRAEGSTGFQKYFYEVAASRIEETIPSSTLDFMREEKSLTLVNHSILNTAEDTDIDLPLFLPAPKHPLPLAQVISQDPEESALSELQASRLRVQNCSLLLPETVFVDRLSMNSEMEVSHLLKYYSQFANTLGQLFSSNSLLSCPLKHFVFSLEEKVLRKRIKGGQAGEGSCEEGRRLRKIREQNNNIILYEVRAFLQAYTAFVWMYLELHQMADSRLGKIINSDILYGVIFKSVWNFVDWVSERGYEYEEGRLEEYYRGEEVREGKLGRAEAEALVGVAEGLRGERHPQQYLKKVVVLYREASRHCQNADELLMIYEYVLGRAMKARGSRDLYIFRMRNIIEKLLKIEDSSMGGGEISYSWTTWCILVELLREKINYQYGNLVISKDSFAHLTPAASFTLEHSLLEH